jgi:hypothetical protein
MIHRVPFIVAELGSDVDPFVLHLFAALALALNISHTSYHRRTTQNRMLDMARKKVSLPGHRSPPRRRLSKQSAVRHLVHAAVRLIAAGEDPFATNMLIQSADKLTIDIAENTKRKLPFTWDEFVKPEYKNGLFKTIRETYNFFKHADDDHDEVLGVIDIALFNLLQLGTVIVNYHALYGTMTNHMRLFFGFVKLVSPAGFVPEVEKAEADRISRSFIDMTPQTYFHGCWTDPLIAVALPSLAAERDEDLQDMMDFYTSTISQLGQKGA